MNAGWAGDGVSANGACGCCSTAVATGDDTAKVGSGAFSSRKRCARTWYMAKLRPMVMRRISTPPYVSYCAPELANMAGMSMPTANRPMERNVANTYPAMMLKMTIRGCFTPLGSPTDYRRVSSGFLTPTIVKR